ncbi:hypothetical protein EV1_026881 [Malus domestica]
MYKLSGRKARWKGRVLDRSLSSGLCHGRCACMAGQKKYLNKKITIFGSEGRQHGVYFCPGSPLRCVVCTVCPFLLFCLLFLLAPNRKQSDMDSGQLRPHRYLVVKGRFDAGRLLLDEPEWPERSLSSQLQVKLNFGSNTSCLVVG